MNIALQCPYNDKVRFKYEKKRISAPELITIMLPVTKQKKREVTNVIKKAHADIFRVTYTLVSS